MNPIDILEKNGYEIRDFAQLSAPYQLAIVHYMALDGDAWEVLGGLDDIEIDKHQAMTEALPLYVEQYGEECFGVTAYPAETVKALQMQDPDIATFADWDAYHAWYKSFDETPAYPETDRWPCFLDLSDDTEVFQDGNHRLHAYLGAGHKDVPVVFFPEVWHLDHRLLESNRKHRATRPMA